MIYVFDTSSFSELKHIYPGIFKSLWNDLDELVSDGSLISTKEVWNELGNGSPVKHVNDWLKERKHIFKTPSVEEMRFVGEIFRVAHFQALIGKQQTLKGTPIADPFVIACAKVHGGTVVTEEKYKPGAARIPNVCEHFGIGCITLEQFMEAQGWNF